MKWLRAVTSEPSNSQLIALAASGGVLLRWETQRPGGDLTTILLILPRKHLANVAQVALRARPVWVCRLSEVLFRDAAHIACDIMASQPAYQFNTPIDRPLNNSGLKLPLAKERTPQLSRCGGCRKASLRF